jgi:hypothetical protein
VAGDQEIALDVRTPNPAPVPTFNAATPLLQAQQLQAGQTANQTGQTQLQMLGRTSQLQDVAYQNQMIANAAAHGFDSDTWDAAFKDAASRGVPGAAQFVGRYNPVLQQRVLESFGAPPAQSATGAAGASGTGASAAPTSDDMATLYAGKSLPELTTAAQRTNIALNAVGSIRDQASLDTARSYLTNNGLPNVAASLPQTWSPLTTPTQLSALYQQGQQRAAWLQNTVASMSSGAGAPLTKWALTDTTDMFGQKRPIAYNPLNPTQSVSVGANNTSQASQSPFAQFAAKMNQAESGGVATAKNPASSATGAGQFIDSTWLDTAKAAMPDLVKGMTDKQILALRSDPQISQSMTEAYARSNATKLSGDGLPVTTATLALAHRFGPDGAETILHASPDDKLSDILPKKVIDANPQLASMTTGQYAQTIAKQFGNTTVNAVQTPSINDFDPSKVDANLTGWDYAAQYPVEVQDAAKAYMNGSVMPSGNPRNQGISTMAKMVAQKVATDLGRPELADDTLYPQRRQMQVELAKTTSPQAVGGQITFGGTALGHLATYAQNLADLGNWTGGATSIGHGINWLRSEGPEQSGQINRASDSAQHYGQEISKFYAGGPAGEAERRRFLDSTASVNPETATPEEMAGLIRGERDLIPERFAQIKANIENVLGPEAAAKALARINVQGSMEKINRAVATLDPSGPEARGLPSGVPAVDPRDVAAFRANSHNPAAAAAIDQKYGGGTAAQILAKGP